VTKDSEKFNETAGVHLHSSDIKGTLTDLEKLIDAIWLVDQQLSIQAARAVNLSLTLRNWLIGMHIQEYELNGSDRASYGDRLIDILADKLQAAGVSRSDSRELRRYRMFYHCYPQIRETLTPEFHKFFPEKGLDLNVSIRETVSPVSGSQLVSSLSYSHFCELLRCESVEKRWFYETECIQGSWSVRELKRQINSLLYERSELSINKQKLREQTAITAETAQPKLVIRDPYVFEFLGLKPQEVMSESNLEDELLNKLQEFLMELGNGFCFEARQKRILIGDKYYFIDLVFYHRLLKCHVLIDLKLEEFTHENIGQLNTYVAWYEKNVRAPDDNPPIGILLCNDHDRTLVEYALAGMSNELFVSKYQLQLPNPEVLRQRIAEERKRLDSELENTTSKEEN
jgi:predicted nuclease of restriction endonuclease-like (RecB) superfamily